MKKSHFNCLVKLIISAKAFQKIYSGQNNEKLQNNANIKFYQIVLSKNSNKKFTLKSHRRPSAPKVQANQKHRMLHVN